MNFGVAHFHENYESEYLTIQILNSQRISLIGEEFPTVGTPKLKGREQWCLKVFLEMSYWFSMAGGTHIFPYEVRVLILFLLIYLSLSFQTLP